MIAIPRIKCGLRFYDVIFSEDPLACADRYTFAHLSQAHKPYEGFTRSATKIIKLSADEGEIFSSLSSNTRYKIRRAEREGITTNFNSDPSDGDIKTFCDHFNPFARIKGLPLGNLDKLRSLRTASALVLTQALDQTGQTVVSHAYIADRTIERLRLLYSASHFRASSDTEERNRIGRANRLLHWQTIRAARIAGYRHYDLGGFPLNDTDPERNAIAKFKSEFGGETITEYNGFISRHRLIQRTIPAVTRIFA
jgi:hypothetical protein